jgi:hypothetical protein
LNLGCADAACSSSAFSYISEVNSSYTPQH